MAAEAGVAYRSDDAGATWHELPSPYPGSWFGGLALDENRVLLAGLRGHLFRSEDGGDTWKEGGHRHPRNPDWRHPVAVGLDRRHRTEGSVLVSEDAGRSVSSRRLPSRRGISAALALSRRPAACS